MINQELLQFDQLPREAFNFFTVEQAKNTVLYLVMTLGTELLSVRPLDGTRKAVNTVQVPTAQK